MATKNERRAIANNRRLNREKQLQAELIIRMRQEELLSLSRIAAATGLSRTGARDVLVRNGIATN